MSTGHPPDERHSLYKFLSFGIFVFFGHSIAEFRRKWMLVFRIPTLITGEPGSLDQDQALQWFYFLCSR